MANEVNVSDRLRVHSSERPNQPAIIVPDGQGWTSITYKALDISVDQYARGFQEKGIERGDRVLFLLKPGIEFYGALLGLFRLGATPVLLDP
ncbi:MAG: acyl-CoA synthetase (AMP-forming)/AMP-acid ligase II, partial [Kiritimatiellia bacterium]